MREMIVNGHRVVTNYPGGWNGYPICNGNGKKTMSMHLAKDCRETDEQMLERLAAAGYKRITFYETTTMVKGCHNLIAFCK